MTSQVDGPRKDKKEERRKRGGAEKKGQRGKGADVEQEEEEEGSRRGTTRELHFMTTEEVLMWCVMHIVPSTPVQTCNYVDYILVPCASYAWIDAAYCSLICNMISLSKCLWCVLCPMALIVWVRLKGCCIPLDQIPWLWWRLPQWTSWQSLRVSCNTSALQSRKK